jgi:glycosyltransferase involved in cell wall biosynthesis
MKIVYVYTALTSIGGVDRVISIKANYFANELGFDVYIITDSQAGRPPIFPLSPKVHHIDLETNFDEQYHYGIIKRYFCYRHLMKLYKKKLTDVLCTIKSDFVLTTCGRDMDFITEIKDGSIKIGESHIAKQFTRNFHLLEDKGFPVNIVAKYWRKKQENAIKKLDAFVVLTKQDAESWKSVRNDVHIIPNPITINPLKPSTCLSPKIISVGRLNEQKGYERLIYAWSQLSQTHKDWEINIYGEGEQKEWLESIIKNENIADNFRINQPTNDIVLKYCESSFYVMTSRFEGLPLVLIEAMSCGLPCVSFDCPNGPSELIKTGYNGILVEEGNINDLAKAIKRLIENPSQRIEMGKNAFNYIQKYSTEFIIKSWIDLFNSFKKN